MSYIIFFLLLSSSIHASTSLSDFIPEASGICRLGETLVIGGDDEPQHLFLSHGSTGKVEKVKVSGAAWDDIEGLASVDETQFFAITSHSRTKKGKRRPEREQLMLMKKDERNITTLKSWNLRDQIISELKKSHSDVLDMKTVESASGEEGGLNIEGLAYREGNLYLGLRSPVTLKGDALIVVIKNPGEDNPVIGDILSANLLGNGIRSLDVTQSGLLMLSGSVDDTDTAFGLTQLTWEAGTLERFLVIGFEKLLRPEGVLSVDDGTVTFVQDFEEPQQDQNIIISLKKEETSLNWSESKSQPMECDRSEGSGNQQKYPRMLEFLSH